MINFVKDLIIKNMKKIILIATVAIFATFATSAQECSTTWPYLYPQFTNGVVHLTSGSKLQHQLNVHVKEGRLHYIENGIVKEAMNRDIFFIQIGGDRYNVVNGDVMRVVESQEGGFVAVHYVADLAKLRETGGAYGSSSTTQATRLLTSIDMVGANTNHMEMWENRNGGESLPINSNYYVVAGKNVYPASKRGIENLLPDEKIDEFRKFLKENKIKWKKPESLIKLVDFLK